MLSAIPQTYQNVVCVNKDFRMDRASAKNLVT